jgi:repressor of nif and glnA expression
MKHKKRTKEEKVGIVMNIIKKLKYFPRSDFLTNENIENVYVNLFNEEYSAIKELKSVFTEYINNEYNLSGKIKFLEINRTIKYTLPVYSNISPVFVLKNN